MLHVPSINVPVFHEVIQPSAGVASVAEPAAPVVGLNHVVPFVPTIIRTS